MCLVIRYGAEGGLNVGDGVLHAGLVGAPGVTAGVGWVLWRVGGGRVLLAHVAHGVILGLRCGQRVVLWHDGGGAVVLGPRGRRLAAAEPPGPAAV